MDNTSWDIGHNNITEGYNGDQQFLLLFPLWPNYFDFNITYSEYNDTDYINNNFEFYSLFGGFNYGKVGFILFVLTCLVICLGLPLTLGAIYGLLSLVRNGEVAPIYVINLLTSDIIQFCCLITEVAQPEHPEIINVFSYIYDYSLLVSVGFMVVIALERYLVVVHPLWYRFRRTIKSSVLVCVLVWILPVVQFLTKRFSDNYRVSFVIVTIFFLLPLPLLIFFLIVTLKALYASISVPTDEKRRITGMLILVLLIYTLLFLPYITLFVYRYLRYYDLQSNRHLDLLYELAPMFVKLSPLADLVLYMLMRKGTIRQLSACLCHCRTDSNEIRSVTVNDVNMSTERDGVREGKRTEKRQKNRKNPDIQIS
ncbi:ovarian cancer G-protein coupled receptor 1-like [Centropristis striata]|uniref:ovarian cancer G-protein coupled receptor 1-like n=1 Tax=Centropristis striata TaxID=184440 RepID=UPI0027E08928|nr:ovarian cancer G-protein coupled receptor 1-like [Centropristis striata]